MNEVNVQTDGVRSYAQIHDQVASGLSQLISGATSDAVQSSHGAIAAAVSTALSGVLGTRQTAMQSTAASGNTISELLHKAAELYERGDQQGAEKLKAAAAALAAADGSPGGGASSAGQTGADSQTGGGQSSGGQSSGSGTGAASSGGEMVGQLLGQAGQMIGQLTQPLQGLTQGLSQALGQATQGVQQAVQGATEGKDLSGAEKELPGHDDDTAQPRDGKGMTDDRKEQGAAPTAAGAAPREPAPTGGAAPGTDGGPRVPDARPPAQTRPQQSPL
jgi:hypothetical protein